MQFQSPGSSKSRGVAILISSRVRFTMSSLLADKDGRYLFVNGHLENKAVTFVALYAPNDNQLLYMKDVFFKLQNFGKGEYIGEGT